MKKVFYILLPIALVAIVVIKLKRNKDAVSEKVYQYSKDNPVNVLVDTVRAELTGNEISYSGTFEPNKETKLSSEVQGKVNEVLVDAGSFVSKGQPLIQLDNALLKLQLQSAEVQIEGLEADVKRYTVLTKADAIQGIQLEKAELGLKAANVQKSTLTEQINKTIIKAPFNGIITAKLTEAGAFAAPGVPLLQLTDISSLKFTVNISENHLSSFQLNQSCRIFPDAYPDLPLTGNVVMVGSKANPGNSFPVQFLVNNTSDLKIKSGMFGRVTTTKEIQKKRIIIPSSAIIGSSGKPQVYKIKNGKAVLQTITLAQKIKNRTVVSGGLAEGDVIVTNGFINLFDNANVVVK